MPSYPTDYAFVSGSGIRRLDNKTIDYAVDGTRRGQIAASTVRYELKIIHDGLLQADVDILRSFYESNAADVIISWPDGNSYGGVLRNWQQTRVGHRWRVVIDMLGDKL